MVLKVLRRREGRRKKLCATINLLMLYTYIVSYEHNNNVCAAIYLKEREKK